MNMLQFEGKHERLTLRLNDLDYLSTDDRLNGNDNRLTLYFMSL